MSVLIETTMGDLVIDLLLKERPRASMNFLKLCKTKYYNYCLFFNVQRDFIAQTGDPTGSGKGGESVFSKLYGDQAAYFEPENLPIIKHTKPGLVSMANNGHNMHGSQFFITLGENLDHLDGVHTVFGEVKEGLDILQKINEVIVDDDNRPYQDIRVTHTVILDDPFPDPAGLDIPERSPSPTAEQLESGRIAPGESVEEYNGLSQQEVQEIVQDKEARARAQILEMVGDLPDADVKPPDNVLFVCKLNPVTTDDDLFIIFSRFGPIKCCEVIRDKKSGDSLQYAFIEFEDPDHCAAAYFKMDNVLIDDRRIHVDFSQSVAKVDWFDKWRFRKNPSNNKPVPPQSQKSAESDRFPVRRDKCESSRNTKRSRDEDSRDKYSSSSRRNDDRDYGSRRGGNDSRRRSRSRSFSWKDFKSQRSRERKDDSSSRHRRHDRHSRSRSSSPRRSSVHQQDRDSKRLERRHSRSRSLSPNRKHRNHQ